MVGTWGMGLGLGAQAGVDVHHMQRRGVHTGGLCQVVVVLGALSSLGQGAPDLGGVHAVHLPAWEKGFEGFVDLTWFL